MQLLRDNLTLWTSDQAEGEEEAPAEDKGEWIISGSVVSPSVVFCPSSKIRILS
jgi:hypothetical protein